jgi:hypothetical protein
MKYFVFVVTPANPQAKDDGIKFRITFQADTRDEASQRFQRYFKGLLLLDIFETRPSFTASAPLAVNP